MRSTETKILALQVGARRDCLYVQINGPFAQKGGRNAEIVSRAVEQSAREAVARFRWQCIPQVRVAVEMRFFARHGRIPNLHHLVKFYLDPLRGLAFADDRQVACLVATSWKFPRALGDRGGQNGQSVFIKIERLVDYVRRLDLCRALQDRFDFQHENGDNYADRQNLAFDDPLAAETGIPESAGQAWYRLNLIEFQKSLLAGNRISSMDRPGGAPRNLAQISRLWKRQAHPLLFTLDLPPLPGQGESREFKKHIREQLRDIRERWGDRGRTIIPVELDVQVPDKGRTPTDLDNVMRRYIAPALTNELLTPPDGYLHGYRIYRVRGNHENAISVKLLAAGAIDDRIGQRRL